MKTQLTNEICQLMKKHLSPEQNELLKRTLFQVFTTFSLPEKSTHISTSDHRNTELINLFIASKKIEGCSGNTLKYYSNTLTKMLETIQKNISVILKIISSCCLICFSPFRSTICIGDEISKIIFVINTSRWNNI